MSREKMIEEMARCICERDDGDICTLDSKSCDCKCTSGSIAELLYDRGYRKQKEGVANNATTTAEWISVEERLPDREGTYLVYTYKGAIKFGDFRCYYAKNDNPQFDYYVTHWMPLPEAPKMKGGAE